MQEINSKPDSLATYLRKIWLHRYLILVFAKRDLKVKYAQTLLGVGWTLVYPATAVLVYTVFFSSLLHIEARYPYVLFVLSGVLCWGIFSYIFNQAGSSLLNDGEMVKKIQFPKIILPLSKCLLALVEFAISFVLFLLLLALFQMPFSWKWLLFPIAVLPVLFASIGAALLLVGGSIKKRDLLYIIPFVVNFSIWFTPVFYPVTLVPVRYQFVLNLNPISSAINLFRNFFFNDPLDYFSFIGLVISLALLLLGVAFFKSVEEKINDTL
jgi:lipopolysaccharide transport system permease protein